MMNWLYWILEFVKAVIWPLTIVIVLLMFRSSITKLFDRKITARWGDTEISFDQKKEEVAKAVVSANNQANFVSTIAAWDVDPFTEDPKTMVRTAWDRIEVKIDSLINKTIVTFPLPTKVEEKIDTLEKSKTISTKTAKSIFGVYQLRKLAIDSSESNLDIEKARDFAILADAALYALTIDSDSKN